MPILTGAPEQVGRRYAEALAPALERFEAPRDGALARLGRRRRPAYLRRYLACVEKWAPHWLDEWRAMADLWRWDAEDLVLWTALRHAPPARDACTTWVAMPDVTGRGAVILHKNRDGGGRDQSLLVKRIDGFPKWIGLADAGAHAPIFVVNDRGLAVAVNNGEPSKENREAGLTTPDILRLVAERCADAAEAVDLLREIVADRAYAHETNGSIWLAADAARAFVVENTAARVASAEVPFGFDVRSNGWFLPGMKAYAAEVPPSAAAPTRPGASSSAIPSPPCSATAPLRTRTSAVSPAPKTTARATPPSPCTRRAPAAPSPSCPTPRPPTCSRAFPSPSALPAPRSTCP